MQDGDAARRHEVAQMIFRRAFKDSLPVLMGYSTMGFAAGALLAVHGGVDWPAL